MPRRHRVILQRANQIAVYSAPTVSVHNFSCFQRNLSAQEEFCVSVSTVAEVSNKFCLLFRIFNVARYLEVFLTRAWPNIVRGGRRRDKNLRVSGFGSLSSELNYTRTRKENN